MKTLLLIDGNSLINRAFYATPELLSSNGTPTNGVYGFVNMLIRMIQDLKTDYILVAFDRKEPTFRHAIYADYKGTRKPMPELLRPQIPLLKEVLSALNIAYIDKVGIEADDIIGTLANKFDGRSIIVTGDKDSFQLVNEKTEVHFTKKGITQLEIYSNDNFLEKFGVKPSQVVDLKACMGDQSDNIPGIAGVGEKTGRGLIDKYGDLDGIYQNVEDLKGKLKEKIEANKDMAYLSRSLATINRDVELKIEFNEMNYEFPFSNKARKFLMDLDFRNIVKRDGVFKNDIVSEEKSSIERVIVIDQNQLPKIFKDKELSIVFGKDINIYDCNKTEYVVKIQEGFLDDAVPYDAFLQEIKGFLQNPSNKLVAFDVKKIRYDMDKYDIEINCKVDDLDIISYLTEVENTSQPLSYLIDKYSFSSENLAYSQYLLFMQAYKALDKDKRLDLYTKMELPLEKVLYEMEKNGFKIDIQTLTEMSSVYSEKLNGLLKKIELQAGKSINPNSPKQLSEVLFNDLGLSTKKKTKSGFSTSVEVLEELEDKHPIVPLIMEYRHTQKLYSTYLESFKNLIDKKTSLMHTYFNQTLTATGRLSSKEPNLQNIPIRSEEGKEIRKMFVSSFNEGFIVSADYSQIELRLLAHFSNSKELVEGYNKGVDIHSLTASQVFNVPLKDVTSEMRQSSKAVNFGIIYGISDFGLAKQLKISPIKAKEYIANYFKSYGAVKDYMQGNVDFAKQNGYISTLLGRKRYIRELSSPNGNTRAFGERIAMNMPLQGTSADIIKLAMIEVQKQLKLQGLKSKLILQVHDELIIDCEQQELNKVSELLKNTMENIVQLKVKLTAEVAYGKTWYDAK